MDPIMILEVGAVVLCWIIAAYAIWKWGPGLRNRSVKCPEKRLRARVVADLREPEFGCLGAADVTDCSLTSERPLSCGKECLSHL